MPPLAADPVLPTFFSLQKMFFCDGKPWRIFFQKKLSSGKDRKHCTHRDTHRLVLFGVLIPNLQSHPTGKYAIAFHRLFRPFESWKGLHYWHSAEIFRSSGFWRTLVQRRICWIERLPWQSDWLAQGVPGISVEQCAWRELFGVGALDSNQRHQKIIGKARTLNSMIEWTAWTDTRILKFDLYIV